MAVTCLALLLLATTWRVPPASNSTEWVVDWAASPRQVLAMAATHFDLLLLGQWVQLSEGKQAAIPITASKTLLLVSSPPL